MTQTTFPTPGAAAFGPACDCHAHVIGPFERYPLSEERVYTPGEAPLADYLAMLDANGFARGVLVHAGAHGWDNQAMLDALSFAPNRLRGIAVVPPEASDQALSDLDAAGIRGIRFTHVTGQQPEKAMAGRLNFGDLAAFAPRLQALGWTSNVWANADTIAENADELRTLGVPVVIDHMGFFDVARGTDDPGFQALLRLVGEGVAWIKLTVFRNSKAAPEFDDVRPFHDALVRANPERLLWGSDWPFLGMKGDPAYATDRLLAKSLDWWGNDALAKAILVDNPARLYGFTDKDVGMTA